ncbi:MAG: aminopeptidase [Bryobacterales bacterium]|nr:aminopeptidase [Bryobacterales bacterium]
MRLGLVLVPVALCALLLSAAGCARRGATTPTQRQQRIARLQDFSSEKGFPRTGNFRRGAPGKEAYFLCYFTRPFALPESYDDLGYRESNANGCGLDAREYDVYFHKVEAVAFENAPVTASLEAASEERALMVAAHEEAHEDPQLERLPQPVAEAATTLLGFLTASQFALREGDGVTATRLSSDAVLYARKARAVNALHDELRALYAAHRKGNSNREVVIAEKARLFARAAEECAEFGTGHSINPCLPVANNAGLAFDHSYTRWYPQLFSLYQACGSDLDRFLAELRTLGSASRRNIKTFSRHFDARLATLGDNPSGNSASPGIPE